MLGRLRFDSLHDDIISLKKLYSMLGHIMLCYVVISSVISCYPTFYHDLDMCIQYFIISLTCLL